MKLFMSFLFTVLLLGCAVNDPVSTQQVVDDRPRLTLNVKGYDVEDLELVVDNISYGRADQYLNTLKALRILPGRHVIEIYDNGRLVEQQERFFGEDTLTEIIVQP